MKKNSTALMAALTLTAIVLGAFLLATNDRPAQANMLDSTPEYSMMTAGVAGGDEALVVLDKSAGKMVVYRLANGTTLAFMGGYDLTAK